MGTLSKGNTSDAGMEPEVLIDGLIWSDPQSCFRENHEMTQPTADCWPQNLVDLGPEDKGSQGPAPIFLDKCVPGERLCPRQFLMLSVQAPLSHFLFVF